MGFEFILSLKNCTQLLFLWSVACQILLRPLLRMAAIHFFLSPCSVSVIHVERERRESEEQVDKVNVTKST